MFILGPRQSLYYAMFLLLFPLRVAVPETLWRLLDCNICRAVYRVLQRLRHSFSVVLVIPIFLFCIPPVYTHHSTCLHVCQ